MRLDNEFTVPATPEKAWALLNDIPRVVPCMPGAELKETIDDDTFKANVHVKLGPISLTFGADIVRDRMDETSRVVAMTTKARELKGRGGATATIESTLTPDGTGTKVSISTELTLSGTVAQYGRGIVADVSNQMVKQFAACIAAQLEAALPAADVALVAEGAGTMGDAISATALTVPRAPGFVPPVPQPVQAVGGLSLALGALFRAALRGLGLKRD